MRAAGLPCAALVLAALVPGVLAGCESVERFYDSKLPVGDAVDWWHRQQGGVIASERPPPPGVGDPYPNLATVPPKPTPTDAASRRALAARLGLERDQAITAAAQDPLPNLRPGTPAPTSARPAAASVAAPVAAPGAAPAAAMATVEAATAAPARAQAPAALPDAAPPPPAFAAAAAATPPSRGQPAGQPSGARFVAGPVPPLPGTPPAVPSLPGIPASTFAPPVPRAAPQVVAAFLPDSAVLRPDSDAALRALATRRGRGAVALLGGGDAASTDPAAQAAALPLAWRRARAMADVLVAAGVPVSAMRIDAAALGRGGVVRLLN